MIELQGKFGKAKIFTNMAEEAAVAQVINLLNQEFVSGSKIRIMPDIHAGAGCTIGTTMTVSDKVVPNIVGVDIGCGVETAILDDERVELQKLDKAIHNLIPSGFGIRKTPHMSMDEIDLSKLRCAKHANLNRAQLSMGTLGGGNHFIELGSLKAGPPNSENIASKAKESSQGKLCLVVHSGSRNLGKQVAEFYQNAAAKALKLKAGRSLAYCEGTLLDDYLHDMAIVQRYADLNRRAIVRELVKAMKFKVNDRFATVHNYIDLDSMILRKGAVSARAGERILIPLNMRDGSLICIGKGNADWNYSAPHGAGRLMSRSAAKQSITLTQFEKSMQGIYSSTVNKSTVDEAPFAYKPMEEITAYIGDTAEIVGAIKPLYNFKAAE